MERLDQVYLDMKDAVLQNFSGCHQTLLETKNIYNIVKTSSLLVKLVMKIWAAHRERDTLYFRVNKRIVILVSYTKVFHLDRFYHHFNFVKRIYEH